MSSIIPINTILDEEYHLEEFDENSDTEEIIDEFKQTLFDRLKQNNTQ